MRAQSSDCPLGAVATQAGAVGEGPEYQQTGEKLQALHERLQEGAAPVCSALDHEASLGIESPYPSPLQAHTVVRRCFSIYVHCNNQIACWSGSGGS